MIIGVDAGALSITDDRLQVGVWRVTYNLLRELARIDRNNKFNLYTFLPLEKNIMDDFGPRMKNVVIRPKFAWSAIWLPLAIHQHPVDVFLGLSQAIPNSKSFNIGFIYDLGFLHNPKGYPQSLTRLKYQTKQLVTRADQIITISESSKKDIEYNFPNHPPIEVAYPGVDSIFSPEGVVHKEKTSYVLMVGSLKRSKNIPLALRAFYRYIKVCKEPHTLVIVGSDYWKDPEIESTIRKLSLSKVVKVKGFVSDKELASYYRGAKALLLTSDWEGFCLPALEAMASGCPVIYRRIGSLPEIMGNAGYSVNSESDVVSALMLRKSSVNGLERSKKFTWSKFALTVHHIINTL